MRRHGRRAGRHLWRELREGGTVLGRGVQLGSRLFGHVGRSSLLLLLLCLLLDLLLLRLLLLLDLLLLLVMAAVAGRHAHVRWWQSGTRQLLLHQRHVWLLLLLLGLLLLHLLRLLLRLQLLLLMGTQLLLMVAGRSCPWNMLPVGGGLTGIQTRMPVAHVLRSSSSRLMLHGTAVGTVSVALGRGRLSGLDSRCTHPRIQWMLARSLRIMLRQSSLLLTLLLLRLLLLDLLCLLLRLHLLLLLRRWWLLRSIARHHALLLRSIIKIRDFLKKIMILLPAGHHRELVSVDPVVRRRACVAGRRWRCSGAAAAPVELPADDHRPLDPHPDTLPPVQVHRWVLPPIRLDHPFRPHRHRPQHRLRGPWLPDDRRPPARTDSPPLAGTMGIGAVAVAGGERGGGAGSHRADPWPVD